MPPTRKEEDKLLKLELSIKRKFCCYTINSYRYDKSLLTYESCKCLDNTITTSSQIFGIAPFTEPQKFKNINYKQDKKSDIYGLGVIFWEISSCCPPFCNLDPNALILEICKGLREKAVDGTPKDYVQLYSDCWHENPTYRPEICDILFCLTKISSTLGGNSLNPFFNSKRSFHNIIESENKVDDLTIISNSKYSTVHDETKEACLEKLGKNGMINNFCWDEFEILSTGVLTKARWKTRYIEIALKSVVDSEQFCDYQEVGQFH
ncbi:13925_t:CDS:2 [Cetraspora pellucida]|uniref:13925_t:CDS:1 n=1 Tax=Cetraspora pellucida TaxID=1433469 RepID=A0A9N8Z1G5_9GLOM|nr:13925_t:CDS:2 [Cetraspora pellucida]